MSGAMKGFAAMYALGFIITFGHSAANAPDPCEGREVCFTSKEERGAVGGFVAGLFWPAYWSWEAWS